MKKILVSKTNLDCLGFLIWDAKLSTLCSPFPSLAGAHGGGREFLLPKGLSSEGRAIFPTPAGVQLTGGSVGSALLP